MPPRQEPSEQGPLNRLAGQGNKNAARIEQLFKKNITSAWIPTTLLNSFATAASPFPTFSYRITRDFRFEFKGRLNVASATSGTVAFVVEAAFKPLEDQAYMIDLVSGTTVMAGVVTISATTGNATVNWSATGGGLYEIKLFGDDTVGVVGDGRFIFAIPPSLDGTNLLLAHGFVTVTSSSGLPTIQIRNIDKAQDMLSTRITINVGQFRSFSPDSPTNPPVINAATRNVNTGDRIAADIDVAGTSAKGHGIILVFG